MGWAMGRKRRHLSQAARESPVVGEGSRDVEGYREVFPSPHRLCTNPLSRQLQANRG